MFQGVGFFKQIELVNAKQSSDYADGYFNCPLFQLTLFCECRLVKLPRSQQFQNVNDLIFRKLTVLGGPFETDIVRREFSSNSCIRDSTRRCLAFRDVDMDWNVCARGGAVALDDSGHIHSAFLRFIRPLNMFSIAN